MSLPRLSTGCPLSNTTTFAPVSASASAANNPAGPRPTTTTGGAPTAPSDFGGAATAYRTPSAAEVLRPNGDDDVSSAGARSHTFARVLTFSGLIEPIATVAELIAASSTSTT